MSCPDFVVTVTDVKAAVAKVRKAIADEGGIFTGDETKGTYRVAGRHFLTGPYSIAGSYAVSGNRITVSNTITATSRLVSCNAVEDKIRKWLG